MNEASWNPSCLSTVAASITPKIKKYAWRGAYTCTHTYLWRLSLPVSEHLPPDILEENQPRLQMREDVALEHVPRAAQLLVRHLELAGAIFQSEWRNRGRRGGACVTGATVPRGGGGIPAGYRAEYVCPPWIFYGLPNKDKDDAGGSKVGVGQERRSHNNAPCL